MRRKPAKERKPHPGRERLPKNLPRVETVIPCADPNCGQCGKETADIRYDISEQLDVEPARYLVRVIGSSPRECSKMLGLQLAAMIQFPVGHTIRRT